MRAKLLRKRATKLDFQGILIEIEHPEGSTRTGTDSEGAPWARKMLCDYGFIRETTPDKGDGEDLDVYVGLNKDAPEAFLVEQLDDDGEFDEFKCVLGTGSEEEARALYLRHYPEGWDDHIAGILTVSVDQLREFVDHASMPGDANEDNERTD